MNCIHPRTPSGLLSRLSLLAMLLLLPVACVTEVESDSLADKFQDLYAVTDTNIVWRSLALENKRFTKIILEPLRYRNTHLNWMRVVPPSARGGNSKAYETAMRSVLAPTFPFVNEGGPQTLRVQTWVTDAVTSEKLIPVARRYRRVIEGTDRLPEVGVEVKFFTGDSQEPVAVFLSTATSVRIQSNLRNPATGQVLMQAYEPFAQRLKNALTFRSWRAFE